MASSVRIVSVGYTWRGDRVVEGTGLENRRASNGTEGSNPSLSARREVVRHLSDHFSFGLLIRVSAVHLCI